jgi:hypothetical protein
MSALLSLSVVAVAGCATPYRLDVYNINRDPVLVVFNGADVGRLTCVDPPLMLTPSLADPAPWQLEVFDEATMQRIGGRQPMVLDGTWWHQAVLVADIGLIAVPPNEPVIATRLPRRPDCPGVNPDLLPRVPAASDIGRS